MRKTFTRALASCSSLACACWNIDHTPDSVKARITAYVVPMTATTAPVKSFDSLREGAVDVRVTTNRNSTATQTHAMTMKTSCSTIAHPLIKGLSRTFRSSSQQPKQYTPRGSASLYFSLGTGSCPGAIWSSCIDCDARG